jgi:hypothetical protein
MGYIPTRTQKKIPRKLRVRFLCCALATCRIPSHSHLLTPHSLITLVPVRKDLSSRYNQLGSFLSSFPILSRTHS